MHSLRILFPALLLSATASGQTQIPVTGICNTGLTKASPVPVGCTTSALVTPVNPIGGGDSVDGNWQLASPAPSAPSTAPAPDACSLTSFGHAFVDAPWPSWLNPDDGLSQYITPKAEGPVAAGGWYVYRTGVAIPAGQAGDTYQVLTIAGHVLVDNHLGAIVIEDPAGYAPGCKFVAIPTGTNFSGWSQFSFSAPVIPHTLAVLYFITYNDEQSFGNPTGLRVEFTSAYLTPE
jgi:hypothetical protein